MSRSINLVRNLAPSRNSPKRQNTTQHNRSGRREGSRSCFRARPENTRSIPTWLPHPVFLARTRGRRVLPCRVLVYPRERARASFPILPPHLPAPGRCYVDRCCRAGGSDFARARLYFLNQSRANKCCAADRLVARFSRCVTIRVRHERICKFRRKRTALAAEDERLEQKS